MARKAAVYKAAVEISDIGRGYYASRGLTLARHPSETEERLMVRLLAFVLFADERLEFGRGLSTDDEPDLWIRDDTGEIQLWVDVGLPDERRLRRAAGRSRSLALVTYGQRSTDVWWAKNRAAMARLEKLTVLALPDHAVADLSSLARKSMELQFTLQDGQVAVSDFERYVVVEPSLLM